MDLVRFLRHSHVCTVIRSISEQRMSSSPYTAPSTDPQESQPSGLAVVWSYCRQAAWRACLCEAVPLLIVVLALLSPVFAATSVGMTLFFIAYILHLPGFLVCEMVPNSLRLLPIGGLGFAMWFFIWVMIFWYRGVRAASRHKE